MCQMVKFLDKLPSEKDHEVEVNSAVTSSVLDSGVYSHGHFENQEQIEESLKLFWN